MIHAIARPLGHHLARVSLQRRELPRNLRFPRCGHALRFVDDRIRRDDDVLLSCERILNHFFEHVDAAAEIRRIDGAERLTLEELCHHDVLIGSGAAGEQPYAKCVLLPDHLLQRRDRLRLDRHEPAPALLRDVRFPAQAEGDREECKSKGAREKKNAPAQVRPSRHD